MFYKILFENKDKLRRKLLGLPKILNHFLKKKCLKLLDRRSNISTILNERSNENKGMEILQQINALLLRLVQLENIYQDPTILSFFKYALTTMVDVKKFSSGL